MKLINSNEMKKIVQIFSFILFTFKDYSEFVQILQLYLIVITGIWQFSVFNLVLFHSTVFVSF